MERELYRYYKPETRGLDFEGMIADLEAGLLGSFRGLFSIFKMVQPCCYSRTPSLVDEAILLVVCSAASSMTDCLFETFAAPWHVDDAGIRQSQMPPYGNRRRRS